MKLRLDRTTFHRKFLLCSRIVEQSSRQKIGKKTNDPHINQQKHTIKISDKDSPHRGSELESTAKMQPSMLEDHMPIDES